MTRPLAPNLSAWLLATAAGRMRRTQPDWAQAMLAEADICTSDTERLGWAWGCWTASLRASNFLGEIAYAAAALTGIGLMSAYEWSTDEGRPTVLVLGLIAIALGALRPSKALLSGALVGLVVTAVIGFEAASGIRPAYEARAQTLADSLCWMVLLAPAMVAAALGAQIGHRLRPAGPAP